MEYCIAYKDRLGNDFNGTPWVLNDYSNLDEVKEGVAFLLKENFQNIIAFKTSKLPEIITWEFVEKHKI